MSRLTQWLSVIGMAAMITVTGAARSQATGVLGEYFKIDPLNASRPLRSELFGCKAPTFTRVDPQINFNWGESVPFDANNVAPPEGFPADHFAVRWTGTLKVDAANAGEKVIIANSDDGMRVWIKDKAAGPILGSEPPVNDQWNDQGGADRPGGSINLVAGKEYYLLTEYYENGGGAQAMLKWRTPDEADADSVAIPTEFLTPSAVPTPPSATDTSAPGAIADLKLSANATDLKFDRASLTFTAPGNDNTTGTSGCYEIRYSNSPLDASTFSKGTLANTTLMPDPAGTAESFQITGLQPQETYYVAVQARDFAGNKGTVSNVATFSTPVAPVPTLPTGTDGQPGAVAYLYSPTPGGSPDRLAAVFREDLLKSTEAVTEINQADAYATDKGLSGDNYAIRYAFTLTFNTAGTWYFDARPDDGMRVWMGQSPVNITAPGPALIDTWADQGPADHISRAVMVEANKPYYFMVEYYESGGGALSEIDISKTNDAASFVGSFLTSDSSDYAMKTYYIKAADYPAGRMRGLTVNANGTPATNSVVTVGANDSTSTFRVNAFGLYSVLIAPGAYTVSASGVTPNGVTGTGSLGTPSGVTSGQITSNPNIVLAPKALAVTGLPAPADKAVYRDAAHTVGGWITPDASDTDANGTVLADRITAFFQSKGYTVVDAVGLAEFMTSHATSKNPSVVVMADDIFPDTVVDTSSGGVVATGNALRSYLDNGGRVVFMADIPLYNIMQSDATALNAGGNGAATVLGFDASTGTWDQNDKPILTPAGQALGLSDTWPHSLRPVRPGEVDITLANANGGSAGWIKLYGTGTNAGAFIRVLDFNPDATTNPITDANLADVQKLAEYSGTFSFVGPVTCKPGDVDGSGSVTVADVIKILQHIAQIAPLTGNALQAADVDSTAGVAVGDAIKDLRFIAQLDTPPAACK